MQGILFMRLTAAAKAASEKFSKILSESAQRQFEYEHQRAIGLAGIPAAAPKQARELAQSEPWTGNEAPKDSALRMLVDTHKPLKLTRSQRLSNARENAIDYEHNKAEGPTHKERLRKPRKTSSGVSGAGTIESIASQQIEDAIARGQFSDLPRGKELQTDFHLVSPYIDHTEYILNNMIKRQGAAPPWIAKQKAAIERIEEFRKQMVLRLKQRLVLRFAEEHPNLSGDKLVERALAATKDELKDPEWEAHYLNFHDLSINDINSELRSYNIQAPPVARKGYLNLDEELDRAYDSVRHELEEGIRRHTGTRHVPKLDKQGLHSELPPVEDKRKHYGLKDLVKDLFKGGGRVDEEMKRLGY